jgi:hypothetical protein
MQTKQWSEELKGRNHPEDQDVDRRSMCRSISKKQSGTRLVDKLDQWRTLKETGMTVRFP